MSKTFATTEQLVDYIIKRYSEKSRTVIAISGFSGSGKSTISQVVSSSLKDSTVIHVDDFIAADENGAKPGYLHDWQNLEELLFKDARSGAKVVTKIYDWVTNKKVYEEAEPAKYLIIEGTAGLFQEKYLQYFDLKVWIDMPQKIANARGMKRDNEEYRVDHNDLWNKVWIPLETESFQRQRPDRKADILLSND